MVTRRSFLVTVGAAIVGWFALPQPQQDTATPDVRNILLGPVQSGPNILWVERFGDKSEIMIWTPETPEEFAEADRFLASCRRAGLGPEDRAG